MKHALKILLTTTPVLAAAAILSGCQTTTTTSSIPRTTSATCVLPVITPLPETKISQEKPPEGGVEISITPVTYQTEQVRHTSVEQTEPGGFINVHDPSKPVYARKTVSYSLRHSPEHLKFLVKINNHLSRVFRGAGTVVQFNVGGKVLAVSQEGYMDLLNAIVPPRTEMQLTISGPDLDGLPEKSTIGVFLYDVVTAQDKAGNVTEKQNYEWYFNCAMTPVTKTLPADTVFEGWMSIPDFQNARSEQMQEQAEEATRQQLKALQSR